MEKDVGHENLNTANVSKTKYFLAQNICDLWYTVLNSTLHTLIAIKHCIPGVPIICSWVVLISWLEVDGHLDKVPEHIVSLHLIEQLVVLEQGLDLKVVSVSLDHLKRHLVGRLDTVVQVTNPEYHATRRKRITSQ